MSKKENLIESLKISEELKQEVEQSEQKGDFELSSEEENNVIEKKRFTWKSFIRISGFTIIFASLSIILMIIGLIVFYRIGGLLRENVGYWLAFIGVIMFLLTVILSFEKIDY